MIIVIKNIIKLKENNNKCNGNQRWIYESPYKSLNYNNGIIFVSK